MNDEQRTKRQEEIERAMSHTLQGNRISSSPATPHHKVGCADITKRVRPQGVKRDRLHNEIFGMFGHLADTEVIIR